MVRIMRAIKVGITVVAAVTTMLWAVPMSPAAGSGWTQVSSKAVGGISGIAAAPNGWLVVHDNKKQGQDRVALLDDGGSLTELTWPGSQPSDLEAVTSVPGQSGVFATLTSTGAGHLISVSGRDVIVIQRFTVPRGTSNIESFALTDSSGTTVALWAVRGSSATPAKVYAATFSPATGTFGAIASGKTKVPYPAAHVRQVADLAVVHGRIIGSATSDPGNAGPFTSALYDLGSISLASGRAALALQTPLQLGVYDHKVEGIACSGTSGILGSDDEKLGGWTKMESFCG